MRYAKDHKEKTRQRIIETAARNFRARGFEGEGIASVMKDAGLTNGAFFNHFTSKEDLAAEVVSFAMTERLAFIEDVLAKNGLAGYVESYLSDRHRSQPERGCTVAALAADVSRRSGPVRDAFEVGLKGLLARLAKEWTGLDVGTANERAIALFAVLSGCVQMARASQDPVLTATIVETARKTAMALVEG